MDGKSGRSAISTAAQPRLPISRATAALRHSAWIRPRDGDPAVRHNSAKVARGARREQQHGIDAAQRQIGAGFGRQGGRDLRLVELRPPHLVAEALQAGLEVAGGDGAGGVEQGAVLGLQPVHHQGGQRLDIALRAFDGGEAGLARGIGRTVADREHLEVAPRAERGEGAHAVGAGEQQGLHAVEVDLGISRCRISSNGSISTAMPRSSRASASGLASSIGRVIRMRIGHTIAEEGRHHAGIWRWKSGQEVGASHLLELAADLRAQRRGVRCGFRLRPADAPASRRAARSTPANA